MNIFKIVLIIFCYIYIMGCSLNQEKIKQRDDYMERAQEYYVKGKYENALTQLNFALGIDPKYKHALVSKGWTLYFLNQFEDSEEIFQKTYKLDDTDPWLNYGLGAIYYKKSLDCSAKIADMLKKAQKVDENSTNFDVWVKQIETEQTQKMTWLNKSQTHFQKAIAIDTGNHGLHKMLAMTYAAKGIDEFPQAIDSMTMYIKLMDQELAAYQKDLAKVQEERAAPDIKEDKKQILDQYVVNLKDTIEDNRLNWQLAEVLMADWNYELAGREARLREETKEPSKKAKHQAQMNKYADQASEILKKLLEVSPDLSNHYRNLAKIALLQDNPDLAIKYLQEFLDKHPLANSRARVEARMEIERILQKKSKQG